MAYAFNLELMRSQVHTAQIIAGQRAAAGAKNTKFPDLQKERAAFDRRLKAAPPKSG